MTKRLHLFVAFFCIICLLVGCGGEVPEEQVIQKNSEVLNDENRIPEHYEKNPDILYSENPYLISSAYLTANGYYNLTGTAGGFYGGELYYHYEIISDPGRLNEIRQLVEDKADEIYRETSSSVFRDHTGKPYDFPQNISDHMPVNEALLEEYDLLMIDHMKLDTVSIKLRPDRLVVGNGIVSLELQMGSTITTTGASSGNVLFILIPKGCETVRIDRVYVRSWSTQNVGPGY